MHSSTKAPHFKSRNGCGRCKAKKIKCDERKPGCARCADRSIPCPGYSLNVRWSHRYQMETCSSSSPRAKGQPSQTAEGPNLSMDTNVFEPAKTTSNSNTTPEGLMPEYDSWNTVDTDWFSPPHDLCDLGETSQVLLPESASNTSLSALWNVAAIAPPWTTEFDSSLIPLSAVDAEFNHSIIPVGDSAISSAAHAQEDQHLSRDRSVAQPRTIRASSSSTIQEIFNIPTALTNYFFSEVITLYCCWDGKSNVMRSIFEEGWQSSGALFHTIQSMAAACLLEDFPDLLRVAQREHRKALECIQTQNSSCTNKEDTLLAHMLLGHTSSWLHPQNLATDAFRSSWLMLSKMVENTRGRSIDFFRDTMDYWAMLLVFLTDSQHLGGYHRGSPSGPSPTFRVIEPHPYSGVSRETVNMLTETGTLIFQYRKRMSKVKFITEKHLDLFRDALREARRLERNFIAYVPPEASKIKDPGDPTTPLAHLQLIDEAYRCTGLLQLYRVFPDLLNERYTPWRKELILQSPAATKLPTSSERQSWLTSLALHVLDILKQIPFESRTRSVQPFIMVAVSSELKRGTTSSQALCLAENEPETPTLDQIAVARARKFLSSRLAAYTHILPLQKIRVISELVTSVWTALDNGEEDVYWLDVAHEKDLGTLMG